MKLRFHPAAGPADPSSVSEEDRLDRALEVARNRLFVGGAFFGLLFAGIAAGLVNAALVGPVDAPRVEVRRSIPVMVTARAGITDRNGMVIATNLPTRTLYADARSILDAAEAAEALRTVLPELDRDKLIADFSSDRAYIRLRRNLTPEQQYKVNRLGIPGLNFERAERRFYPQGALFSHVLGFTDIDNNGIAGMEKQFDTGLRSGQNLTLSLDMRAQYVLRDALGNAIDTFSAIGGAAVLMAIKSGEIHALVSLPDFDPHWPGRSPGDGRFNRATKGVYELGSIFKLITAAIALDTGAASLNTAFDATRPLKIGPHRIRDSEPENRVLLLPEVLVYSSNIGTARMALSYGGDIQQDYLQRLGLFDRVGLELPERGRPLKPSPWREVNTMTISFGHGLSVSPLHLASAVATLANGGVSISPTLLRRSDGDIPVGKRVFSERTSALMRRLMRLMVTEGYGKGAESAGYFVGGKTGTAEKLVNGRYSNNKRMSSFAAVFPMHNPQFVLLVSIDEPKGIKETFGYAGAGWTAAPAAGEMIKRVAPLLGVEPADPDDPALLKALHVNFPKEERRLASY